mgnify:CR=1 FL=1
MTDQKEFDVFLCHNSLDKDSVSTIAEKLNKQDIVPWIDEGRIKGGDHWPSILFDTINKTEIAFIFLGTNGIGNWQQMEIDRLYINYTRSKKKNLKIVPVLLPGASNKDIPEHLQDFHFVTLENLEDNGGIGKLFEIFSKKDSKLDEGKKMTQNNNVSGNLYGNTQTGDIHQNFSR